MVFAEILRIMRAAHTPPLSQRDAARLARIHHDRYWKLENGCAIARPDEIARLTEVLRMPEVAEVPVPARLPARLERRVRPRGASTTLAP